MSEKPPPKTALKRLLTISTSKKVDLYYDKRPGTTKRWKVDEIIFDKEDDAINYSKMTGTKVVRVWIAI